MEDKAFSAYEPNTNFFDSPIVIYKIPKHMSILMKKDGKIFLKVFTFLNFKALNLVTTLRSMKTFKIVSKTIILNFAYFFSEMLYISLKISNFKFMC